MEEEITIQPSNNPQLERDEIEIDLQIEDVSIIDEINPTQSIDEQYPYIPEDTVFEILQFLPDEYTDDQNDDGKVFKNGMKYPFYICRLISRTWHKASCRDFFWKKEFEKLKVYIDEPYNWKDEPHRSLYLPRKITKRLLFKKKYSSGGISSGSIDKKIQIIDGESQGYMFYEKYMDMIKSLQGLKRGIKLKENGRVKFDTLKKSVFEMNSLVNFISVLMWCIFFSIGIQSLHPFWENQFYLTNRNYIYYISVYVSFWVSLFIIVSLLIYHICSYIHLRNAQLIITNWKYKEYKVFKKRTLKIVKKNARNKIFALILLLILTGLFISSFGFLNLYIMNKYYEKFLIYLPLILLCFFLSSTDVFLSLLNGGMLYDGFPSVTRYKRLISIAFQTLIGSGMLIFLVLHYYDITSDMLYIDPYFYISLICSEGILIMKSVYNIFEKRERHHIVKHVKDFHHFDSKYKRLLINGFFIAFGITLIAGHITQIICNYTSFRIALHYFLYNCAVIELTIIAIFYIRWMKNEYVSYEYDTKYNSDYDSTYAM